ncbi:MAG: hypothetical protein MJZ42_05650 [Bacteroidales bacterium]|nr:hypothetical protein [Bacteroidales bacterium]
MDFESAISLHDKPFLPEANCLVTTHMTKQHAALIVGICIPIDESQI